MSGGLRGGPARLRVAGGKSRHRALHRSARNSRRRRCGRHGGHRPAGLRPDRPRLHRRKAGPCRPPRPAGDPAADPGADHPQTRYLFENTDDPRLLGLDPSGARDDHRGRRRRRCGGLPRQRRCRRRRPFASPWWRACCGPRASISRSRPRSRRAFGGGRRTLALRRARPLEPEGDSRSDPEALECRARNCLAWSHRRRRGRSGAIITWPACPPAGGEGLPRTLLEAARLRARHRHHRRARLPDAGPRRDRRAWWCGRATCRR